jgi:hypothetical protein
MLPAGRTMSLPLRTVVSILLFAPAAVAGPPSITPRTAEWIGIVALAHPPAAIREAVARLAANDFPTREAGQRALEAMGPSRAAYFAAMRPTVTDPEARRRLDTVIQSMRWNHIGTARTLTVSATRISAPDALRLIANKAGYRMTIDPLGDDHDRKKLYDFDFPSLSMWEAIDRVCNASGLAVTPDDDGTLRVSYQDTYHPIAAYDGPFRFVPTQIYSGRYLQLGGLSRRQIPARNVESLTLNLLLTAEPKSPIVGVRGCTLVKVIDQDGKELPQPPTDERASQYYGGQLYRSFQQNLNLSFQRPSVESTSLKSVRGKAHVTVLAETRPDVVVSDLMKAKGRKFKGRSGSLEITDVVDQQPNPPALVIALAPANQTPQDYGWINSVGQKLEAKDAQGRPYAVTVNSTNFGSDGSCTLTVMLVPADGTKPGPPATLVLHEWITRSMDLEFEFKDVPLP